uniref:Uncharacterized protein n=1 Tax=Fagus sylvatica TaxID=28930 RepID=A0A2N9GX38_FAGSY
MASRYWRPMYLLSWAPRAKIFPLEDLIVEKGGWGHLEGLAGTESMWELKRREGREGFEHGQVRRRRGFLGVNSQVWDWRLME